MGNSFEGKLALTQLKIHEKEFGTKFRGYDKDEVEDFLELIISDYSKMLAEIQRLQKELSSVNGSSPAESSLEEIVERVAKLEQWVRNKDLH